MRCARCGKQILDGEESVEISTGSFQSAGPGPLTESTRWGIMHKSCFNRSIDSPEATLEELRKLSESK